MTIVMLIVTVWLGARVLPAMLVSIIAMIIAIILAISSRRNALALIASRARHVRGARWEDRPSRADRRLLARSLRTSMRQTINRSLFPSIAARADDIVAAADKGGRLPILNGRTFERQVRHSAFRAMSVAH